MTYACVSSEQWTDKLYIEKMRHGTYFGKRIIVSIGSQTCIGLTGQTFHI